MEDRVPRRSDPRARRYEVRVEVNRNRESTDRLPAKADNAMLALKEAAGFGARKKNCGSRDSLEHAPLSSLDRAQLLELAVCTDQPLAARGGRMIHCTAGLRQLTGGSEARTLLFLPPL